MKRHLLILAALGLPALSATADSATSFADAAKRHRIGDTAAAMAFWQPLAQQGDTNAAYNLAVIHEYGDGVTKSLPEGFKWYRIAAERGDRASQSRLGTMYLNGEGTAKDEKEGWRWINAHRLAHAHHDHHPQMLAWRKRAAELIWASDMREALAASRGKSDQIMADLRRRAGDALTTGTTPQRVTAGLAARE